MRRRFINNNRFNENSYLTIEALEDDLSVSFAYSSTNKRLEYTIDGDSWCILQGNIPTPPIKKQQKISFRCELPAHSTNIGQFSINKSCNLLGNCMSIIFGDNANKNNSLSGFKDIFFSLFLNCSNIVSVSKNFLPATTLCASCYSNMFRGCTRLIAAPELPATTLADYCYADMFSGCRSLKIAPVLPAITLKKLCYLSMFFNCRELNYIKALFTTTPDFTNTNYWVYGVISAGTFIKNKNATWNVTGVNGIPEGWRVQTV